MASLAEEKLLNEQGFTRIGGIDEAGRGPLAGPVCAAVVVFEPGTRIRGVNDSKLLSPEERECLFEKITSRAVAFGVGFASCDEIDAVNILRATHLAVRRALRAMPVIPDYLLLDALRIDKCTIPQRAFVKGDSRCFSIAAASIVAKVSRDRLMVRYAQDYPHYKFDQHKGYATPTHRRLIEDHGPCTLHRTTFLTDWFGTIEPRHSLSCVELASQLEDCHSHDDLGKWLQRVREKRDFIPRCEWNHLIELARKRHAALSIVEAI